MTDLIATKSATPALGSAHETRPLSLWRIAWLRLRRDRVALFGAGLLVLAALAAILAPLLAPDDPLRMQTAQRLAPPGTAGYLLGTDHTGRDVLSRLLWGARVSLLVSIVPVIVSASVGTTLGLLAGYFGGWLDHVIMRVLDVLFAFPAILLAIAIVAALGPGLNNAVLALIVVAVPVFARIVRGSTLALREREYVTAARALGATNRRIIFRHVLPNVLAPLIVFATLETGRMLIFAASLSFLGLGAQPPQPEWGAMLADGRDVIEIAPHVATIPGLAIIAVTLGLNLLGDGLRDALDPSFSER